MVKMRLTLSAIGVLAACGAFAGPAGLGTAILNQSLIANTATNLALLGASTTVACTMDSYQIVKGTWWSGTLLDTEESDNSHFVIQSLSSGITRFLDVNMTCENLALGTPLTKIEVRVEASATAPASFAMFAWSWTANSWIAFGSLSLQTGDNVAYFVKTTSLARFISSGSNKKFKLRFYRTSSPRTTVRVKFDQVQPRFTYDSF